MLTPEDRLLLRNILGVVGTTLHLALLGLGVAQTHLHGRHDIRHINLLSLNAHLVESSLLAECHAVILGVSLLLNRVLA